MREPGNCTDFPGYKCVSQDHCRDGLIVTDGPHVLDLKQASSFSVNIQPELSKCPGDLEVCCLQDPGLEGERYWSS